MCFKISGLYWLHFLFEKWIEDTFIWQISIKQHHFEESDQSEEFLSIILFVIESRKSDQESSQ